MRETFLTFDLGTTALKTALICSEGKPLAVYAREYTPQAPQPDWAEMTPEVYWQAALEGTRAVFRQTNTDPSTLAGIGFSSQAQTFGLFDLETSAWEPRLLDSAGITCEQLPVVLSPGSVAGKLLPQAAAELGLRARVPVSVGANDQMVGAVGAGKSSHEEAGADTLLHGGAATHKPFPNLSRGFKKHVENSPCKPEAGLENLHTQPNHQMLRRPCGVSKLETEAVVWPVRTIPHRDHPRINGSGCNSQPLQQVAKHGAQIRNHFLVYPFLSSRTLTLS